MQFLIGGIEVAVPVGDKLDELREIATSINRSVNLYSPDSATDFTRQHLVHSLAIAVRSFPAGSRVVDWGTGGGMPGLPLAIVFPEVEFILVDSIGKKIRAARTMARRLRLGNVDTWQGRAEEWKGDADYSVSRATVSLEELWKWHSRVATRPKDPLDNAHWRRGLVCLKGGEMESEISELRSGSPDVRVETTDVSAIIEDLFFLDKRVVSVSKEV